MRIIRRFLAVVGTVWFTYNLLVFAEIATGSQMRYIPYLNFPIKLIVSAVN